MPTLACKSICSERAERIHDVEHLEREVRHPARMVVRDDRQPAGDHVCIADRLDLLEPALRDRMIKVREYRRQDVQHACRRQSGRKCGEANEIGKQDGYFCKMVGDYGFTIAHPRHHRMR